MNKAYTISSKVDNAANSELLPENQGVSLNQTNYHTLENNSKKLDFTSQKKPMNATGVEVQNLPFREDVDTANMSKVPKSVVIKSDS